MDRTYLRCVDELCLCSQLSETTHIHQLKPHTHTYTLSHRASSIREEPDWPRAVRGLKQPPLQLIGRRPAHDPGARRAVGGAVGRAERAAGSTGAM